MKIVETLIAPDKFQNTVAKNFEVKMSVGKDPDKFRKKLKYVEFVPDKYFFVSKIFFKFFRQNTHLSRSFPTVVKCCRGLSRQLSNAIDPMLTF